QNRCFGAQQISPLGKTRVSWSELRNCRNLNTPRGLGQTQNVQSPEGSFLKAPMPLPLGEAGRGRVSGSLADTTTLLGGLTSLAICFAFCLPLTANCLLPD